MEKKFFRMARIFLGVPVIQRSEELVFDDSTLIPVILDIEGIMRDEGKLAELFSLQKQTRHKNQKQKRIILLLYNKYKQKFLMNKKRNYI